MGITIEKNAPIRKKMKFVVCILCIVCILITLGFGSIHSTPNTLQRTDASCINIVESHFGSSKSSKTHPKEWILVQRTKPPSRGFKGDKKWEDFKQGFGNLTSADYWIGNEKLHQPM